MTIPRRPAFFLERIDDRADLDGAAREGTLDVPAPALCHLIAGQSGLATPSEVREPWVDARGPYPGGDAGMRSIAGLLVLSVGMILTGSTVPSSAAAMFGWRVADVPAEDVLHVRAFPDAKSTILVGYPNGTQLSLTGRCTGGLRLDAISGQPSAKQQQRVRSRWCELWLDPTGSGAWRSGWVRGRYIRPL